MLDGSSPRVRGKPETRSYPPSTPRLIPARAGKTPTSSATAPGGRAHPRACGENTTSAAPSALPRGSSPRVRGKHDGGHQGQARARLIPARAGKTSSQESTSATDSAHPRACGENGVLDVVNALAGGSSPRVRGKRPGRRSMPPRCGLIPARAGKTAELQLLRVVLGAHPRACGENHQAVHRVVLVHGSSPRVRGKRRWNGRERRRGGLIPARTGKTTSSWTAARRRPAHPRACGENNIAIWSITRTGGSSPRVRGKLMDKTHVLVKPGLIPARAGKTSGPPARSPRRWAHPRACGENFTRTPTTDKRGGSSPRVRGKPRRRPRNRVPPGLIPARAGKTSWMEPPLPQRRAHPRACGENEPLPAPACVHRGSSPRVRGKPGPGLQEAARRGLIPARAGKTFHVQRLRRRVAAHPRACGENRAHCFHVAVGYGSSPRVRGKRSARVHPQPLGRLIPARAGKTLV